MRLPAWAHLRSQRRTGPRTVTCVLTVDTSQFVAAMAEAHEGIQMAKWRRRIRRERLIGMAFVGEELDRMCRDLGMDPKVWRL